MKGFISLKNEEIGKGELKNKILLIKVFLNTEKDWWDLHFTKPIIGDVLKEDLEGKRFMFYFPLAMSLAS